MQAHWGSYSAPGSSSHHPAASLTIYASSCCQQSHTSSCKSYAQACHVHIGFFAAPTRLSQVFCATELRHHCCIPGSCSEVLECSLRCYKRCCTLQAVAAAQQFNASWDSDIQLLRHDCHHHTADLVHDLTGKEVDVWKLFPFQRNTIWM